MEKSEGIWWMALGWQVWWVGKKVHGLGEVSRGWRQGQIEYCRGLGMGIGSVWLQEGTERQTVT